MTDDPGVRSVRVAVVLCERFAELLKGPDQVRSVKQHGRLVGVGGFQEDFSLRLGEVQQIYPEIWRHLDEARATFAGRGVDVSAFDRIREQEGLALGANPDMVRQSHGSARYGYDETVKSANFNKEGYARAVKAYQALMAATPDIPWAAIAKAEDEDPNLKAFTRATKTKRYIMFGLLALVIAAPFLYVMKLRSDEKAKYHHSDNASYDMPEPKRLDAAALEALGKSVTAASTQIADARAAWTAAVTPAALAALQPGANPCEYKFVAPDDKATTDFVRYGNAAPAAVPEDFEGYLPNVEIPDARLATVARFLDGLAARVKTGTAGPRDQQQMKDLPKYVVFVVAAQVMPELHRMGEVTGKGYVFSIAAKKIVCVGPIDAKNVETDPNFKDLRSNETPSAMRRDLEAKIRKNLAAMKSI